MLILTMLLQASYLPAAFLTGVLDPVQSREEFLELFANLEGKTPVLVVSAKGVSKFVEVPGALLPQEEYPAMVAEELYKFLQENFKSNF